MEDQTIAKKALYPINYDLNRVLVQVISAFIVAIAGHALQHIGFTLVGCLALSVAVSIGLYNLYILLKPEK